MISEFKGEYFFLSNFFLSNQVLPTPTGLLTFRANEYFFVFCKTQNVEHKLAILNAPTPGIAKRMGGPKGYVMPDGSLFKIDLRPDWPQVRDPAMIAGVELKFGQNLDLKLALIATHPQELQEGNMWWDEYWGINLRTGKGQNKLGKMLMDLRGRFILAGMPVDHKLPI